MRKMLNPEAPEYLPISHSTPTPDLLHFHHPFYYPRYIIPPTFQNVSTNYYSPPQQGHDDLQQSAGNNFSPPPPPPSIPAEGPPVPSDPDYCLPVAVRDDRSISNQLFPRVITGRKYIPGSGRRPRFWSFPYRGRGRGQRRHGFGFGTTRERIRSPIESSNRLNKHGMIPLKIHEEKTTLMIKNIPYEFTRLNLMEFLDKHCMEENLRSKEEEEHPIHSAYDFLYLPIDFKTKKNKGYAFVNFNESRAVWKFFNAFNGRKWDSSDSPKIRRIVSARIQGKEALVKHFERTYFDCESDEFLPACFNPARDGSVNENEIEISTVGRRRRGVQGQVSSGSPLESPPPEHTSV